MEREMRIMNCVQVFFVHKGIISAVKRVEFDGDRMSYIILRGRWCHISVLNVHALKENRIYDVYDSFYGELECEFDKFLKYYINILLGNFNAKVGREDILSRQLEMKVYMKLVMIMELEK
jgi:hypothetical protein